MAVLAAACSGGAEPPARVVSTSMGVEVRPALVELTMHVTNVGEAPLVLTFPSARRYDFWVVAESGEEVWRWSDGMAFSQVVTTDTLAPDDTWRLAAEWSPGDRAGPFTAVGTLTARDTTLEQRVRFELP